MRVRKLLIPAVSSIFFLSNLTGQENFWESTVNSFDEYFSRAIREKIFLLTDRTVYLPGETIFFKLYSLDTKTNAPATLSKVAYIELLTNKSTRIAGVKIEVNNASGSGYIHLPTNLASGYYYIRAYTHWMKNLAPANFFTQKLAIIDPFNRLYEFTDSTALVNTHKLQCKFYPEGGKLIRNVESLICVQLTNLNGSPESGEGLLLDEKDSLIARLTFDKNGLAAVRLHPLPGKKYRITLEDKSGLFAVFPVPEADSTGLVLQYLSSDNTHLNLQITGHASGMIERLWLGLVSDEGLTFSKDVTITLLPIQVKIPLSRLGRDINMAFITDPDRNIVSERMLYNPVENLNITINTSKSKFNNREKVTVDILTETIDGQPVAANLSVAVPRSETKEILETPGINAYGSVLSGIHSSISWTDQGSPVDLILLSNEFNLPVSAILVGFKQQIRYYPELEGITASGTVIDPSTGKPVRDVLVFLSSVGNDAVVTVRESDENGRFYFFLEDAYGDKDVVLQIKDNPKNYIIRLDEKFSSDFVNLPVEPLMIDDRWKLYIEDQMFASQVRELYYTEELIARDTVPSMQDFYVQPDIIVQMEEFIRLPLMEEVFRELVKRTIIARERGVNKIEVVDLYSSRIIGEEPLLLVDGIPVFDHETVLNINPEELSSIETVSFKYFKNLLEMDGIVDIKTNSGDLSLPDMPSGWVRRYYQALQVHENFNEKRYDNPDEACFREPDFRNQLYWNPSLSTNSEGKASFEFYASDINASYNIIIQGITKDGLAGSGKAPIEIGQ